jgi:hypothetical protein
MFHTLALTLLISTSLASTCSDPPSLDIPFPQKFRRNDPEPLPDILSEPADALANPIALPSQWLPPQFLPPPWSPDSDLDSPYPSGGVSPWDDSGRSQIMDNEVIVCPRRHLDCRKCPADVRCRGMMTGGGGEMGATTEEPEGDGNENCPMNKCDKMATAQCGAGAKCTQGYCVCELGMKAATGLRGTKGLGAVTVYVGPAVDCRVKCDDPSCKEVEQMKEGVCYKSGDEDAYEKWYEDNIGEVIARGSIQEKRAAERKRRML